eukprot:1158165-Pelagomonas_calceolata.AAC.10
MERTAHIYATGQPCVAHGAMHLLRAAHGCKCICCVWRMGPMRCVLSTLWPAGGACAEGVAPEGTWAQIHLLCAAHALACRRSMR